MWQLTGHIADNCWQIKVLERRIQTRRWSLRRPSMYQRYYKGSRKSDERGLGSFIAAFYEGSKYSSGLIGMWWWWWLPMMCRGLSGLIPPLPSPPKGIVKVNFRDHTATRGGECAVIKSIAFVALLADCCSSKAARLADAKWITAIAFYIGGLVQQWTSMA